MEDRDAFGRQGMVLGDDEVELSEKLTVMGENPLLHLLVVIVEPGEGGLLGLVVETLQFEI